MDYGNMLSESFEYAREGLVGKWMKWLLLLVATILLAIPLLGYELKILRGEKPSPEITDWGTLIVDGIKYLVIVIVYCIPLAVIAIVSIAPLVMAAIQQNMAAILAGVGAFLIGLAIFVIVAVIIGLIAPIGIIRFARTGSMSEAFNFGAILGTIGRIGWINYILALIIIAVIVGFVQGILMAIPIIGGLVTFILFPFFVLFETRYLCQVYDSAGNL
jgi:hypothetical protein